MQVIPGKFDSATRFSNNNSNRSHRYRCVSSAIAAASTIVLTFTILVSPPSLYAASAKTMCVSSTSEVGETDATPPLSDAIKRVDPKYWQLKIEGQISAYQDQYHLDQTYQEFNLKNTPLVFPVIPDGGFHTLDLSQLRATLYLDGHEADSKFELIPTNDPTVKLARFVISKFEGQQIRFSLDEIETSYAAKVDEKALQSMPWTDTFPAEAQASLLPQRYIESTDALVAKLVDQWTKGKAKSVTPYLLGKELARQVGAAFRPNGTSLTKGNFNQLVGLEVNGALSAINKGMGPANDGICLYVAVCRAAGLPARPVIGVDMKDPNHDLVTWAEFYVPNAGWISVDMRKYYEGPGTWNDIYTAWPGVGTNEHLNLLVPIAYHFHPPVGVRAEGTRGKPLLWGWAPMPEAIVADQSLRLTVMTAPMRGPNLPGNGTPPVGTPGVTPGQKK